MTRLTSTFDRIQFDVNHIDLFNFDVIIDKKSPFLIWIIHKVNNVGVDVITSPFGNVATPPVTM